MRASRVASGGAQALFEGLHDTVTWQGDRLRAADPYSYQGTLSGEGLILVPSARAWPRARKMVAPYQRTIIYTFAGSAPCGRPVGRLLRKHSAPWLAVRGRSCWLPSTRRGPPATSPGSSR